MSIQFWLREKIRSIEIRTPILNHIEACIVDEEQYYRKSRLHRIHQELFIVKKEY